VIVDKHEKKLWRAKTSRITPLKRLDFTPQEVEQQVQTP
jgi:hypothetical protein